jgi:hypothetical protein
MSSPPRRSPALTALALVALSLALIAASPALAREHRRAAARATAAAVHALFIGNSYTGFNDLPHMVQRIAEEVPNGPELRATKIANPGWDLSRHWEQTDTRAALAGGGFTHVVLQGHSLTALEHRDQFEEYARRFDGEIDRVGARTVLYETWARRPGSAVYRTEHLAASPVDMQARVSECYVQLARSIDADLAPVGRAFLLAQQRLGDDVTLFRADGHHPTPDGTFLAASVIYAAITRGDPRQSTWRPFGMSRRLATELRDIAVSAISGPQ